MSSVVKQTPITPEEFLELPDQKDFELIDGELVSRYGDRSDSRVCIPSSWVGGQIIRRLQSFCEGRQVGWCFPADRGFQCFFDRPKTVRKPDVSFKKWDRTTWEQTHGRMAPNRSRSHRRSGLTKRSGLRHVEKVEVFPRVGVPLIWVVNPQVRIVRVIRGDRSTESLREFHLYG